MSVSRTQTCTTTQVGDLRLVLNCVDREIIAICSHLSGATPRFSRDKVIQDISILALREIISIICLQFFRDGEVVREHSYHIAESGLEEWGPPPEEPPLGDIPPGCEVRLVTHRNPAQPDHVCDEWFARLGWHTAPELAMPDGEPVPYGTFVSGGYGVERRLLVNPRCESDLRSPAMERSEP